MRRTFLLYRQNQCAGFFRQIIEAYHAAVNRNRLRRDADIAAADASVAEQTAGDELRGVDTDGEAYSLCGQNRRRVYAHHASYGIYQRPAGVARVQRSVGLDYIVDQAPGIGPQRPSQGTDHTRRHRGLESVRVADCNYQLTYTKLLRVAESCGGKAGFVDTDHSEVAGRIVADCSRRHAAAIG